MAGSTSRGHSLAGRLAGSCVVPRRRQFAKLFGAKNALETAAAMATTIRDAVLEVALNVPSSKPLAVSPTSAPAGAIEEAKLLPPSASFASY